MIMHTYHAPAHCSQLLANVGIIYRISRLPTVKPIRLYYRRMLATCLTVQYASFSFTRPARARSQHRSTEWLSKLERHDVVEDRVDDCADVIQHTGHVVKYALECVRRRPMIRRRSGFKFRFVKVHCDNCFRSVPFRCNDSIAREVDGHQALRVERSPADEKGDDNGNWNA